MNSPDVRRLSEGIRLFEEYRGRLRQLRDKASRLSEFDVLIVVGEQAVLEHLELQLNLCRRLLISAPVEGNDANFLDRLEYLVRQSGWSVLEEVEARLDEKEDIAAVARREVAAKLAIWSGIAGRVEEAGRQIQLRRLRIAEPRRLTTSRDRLTALVRHATISFQENRYVEVWQALNELERAPAHNAVPLTEVPSRLETLVRRASPEPLQLTVLRGEAMNDNIQYALTLQTPTGDQYVAVRALSTNINVQLGQERFARDAQLVSPREVQDHVDAVLSSTMDLSAGEDRLSRLREVGRILYRKLIPIPMQDVIELHPGVPLVLTSNDRSLAWEFMAADDFVALQRPLARLPVGHSRRRRSYSGDLPSHRRQVALVGSAGTGKHLSAVEREVKTIHDGLTSAWSEEADVKVLLTGTNRPANKEDFERVLVSGYDIIHFAGHAAFNERKPGLSGLLFDDEKCTAEDIGPLIGGAPLVFLNACETARHGDEPVFGQEGAFQIDPWEGLAAAFLRGGALACIGNVWPVVDAVAARFAIAFYSHALEGLPLGEAIRLARRSVAQRYPKDPSWASFVFYGNPAFTLAVDGKAVRSW
ncbi:CHAT domain-containing protein [Paractinoplanes globisporus]|uniref:CHAT domain-containing protein n=1 Tax=Paractinoplanes globisporus TaxID=113565 RepID=A0ABW6WTE6_9ACTN|nr:CHAT domain-containing protein [Actinoplanes globisporus]